MLIGLDDRRMRYLSFLLVALAINGIDSALVRSMPRLLVAAAASLDVVVVVTAIYYWLLVRPGMRSRWSVIAIALVGVLHATYFYPNAAAGRAIFAGLCEVSLIGWVAIRVRQGIRRGAVNSDPLDAIRTAVTSVFPISLVADMLAVEFSILYYALFSWRASPHVPPGAKAFSIHKREGQADLLFALAFVAILETVPTHFLINHWSPAWAWIATGLSVYSAVWLIGLARSIELRPVLVGLESVHVRYGLLFRLCIPAGMIACVRRAEAGDSTAAVTLPRRSEPNLRIELRSPMDAVKLFGARRRTHQVALAADEPAAALEAMGELMSR